MAKKLDKATTVEAPDAEDRSDAGIGKLCDAQALLGVAIRASEDMYARMDEVDEVESRELLVTLKAAYEFLDEAIPIMMDTRAE